MNSVSFAAKNANTVTLLRFHENDVVCEDKKKIQRQVHGSLCFRSQEIAGGNMSNSLELEYFFIGDPRDQL